jgi:small subunit ribosomal protein S13
MKLKNFRKTAKQTFGLGINNLKCLYKKIGLNYKKKIINIKCKQESLIGKVRNRVSYSDTLKTKIRRVVNFYVKLKNYKGIRHNLGYPVRGQRTHTNAKTRKKFNEFKKKSKI